MALALARSTWSVTTAGRVALTESCVKEPDDLNVDILQLMHADVVEGSVGVLWALCGVEKAHQGGYEVFEGDVSVFRGLVRGLRHGCLRCCVRWRGVALLTGVSEGQVAGYQSEVRLLKLV